MDKIGSWCSVDSLNRFCRVAVGLSICPIVRWAKTCGDASVAMSGDVANDICGYLSVKTVSNSQLVYACLLLEYLHCWSSQFLFLKTLSPVPKMYVLIRSVMREADTYLCKQAAQGHTKSSLKWKPSLVDSSLSNLVDSVVALRSSMGRSPSQVISSQVSSGYLYSSSVWSGLP